MKTRTKVKTFYRQNVMTATEFRPPDGNLCRKCR